MQPIDVMLTRQAALVALAAAAGTGDTFTNPAVLAAGTNPTAALRALLDNSRNRKDHQDVYETLAGKLAAVDVWTEIVNGSPFNRKHRVAAAIEGGLLPGGRDLAELFTDDTPADVIWDAVAAVNRIIPSRQAKFVYTDPAPGSAFGGERVDGPKPFTAADIAMFDERWPGDVRTVAQLLVSTDDHDRAYPAVAAWVRRRLAATRTDAERGAAARAIANAGKIVGPAGAYDELTREGTLSAYTIRSMCMWNVNEPRSEDPVKSLLEHGLFELVDRSTLLMARWIGQEGVLYAAVANADPRVRAMSSDVLSNLFFDVGGHAGTFQVPDPDAFFALLDTANVLCAQALMDGETFVAVTPELVEAWIRTTPPAALLHYASVRSLFAATYGRQLFATVHGFTAEFLKQLDRDTHNLTGTYPGLVELYRAFTSFLEGPDRQRLLDAISIADNSPYTTLLLPHAVAAYRSRWAQAPQAQRRRRFRRR